MSVFLFRATSSPSICSYALRRAALDNEVGADKEVVEAVLTNFYVDDVLKSFSDEFEARKQIPQLRKLLQERGFHFTKFVSNQAVLDGVPEVDERGENNEICALGILWNLSSDCVGMKFQVVQKSYTRRILSIISQIYDLLGFVQSFLLPAKILLQELSVNGLGWSEEVSEKAREVGKHWYEGLKELLAVRI